MPLFSLVGWLVVNHVGPGCTVLVRMIMIMMMTRYCGGGGGCCCCYGCPVLSMFLLLLEMLQFCVVWIELRQGVFRKRSLVHDTILTDLNTTIENHQQDNAIETMMKMLMLPFLREHVVMCCDLALADIKILEW
jgi:hypothetical protein